VRFAEPNYVRRLAAVPNDPRLLEQWALEQIRVQGLWNEVDGVSDAIVAIVDSGIAADHPDVAGRLVDGYDFANLDSNPHDSTSNRAHGTMVGSIAAAATDNAYGMSGAAWGARIMPLKVFTSSGSADIFRIAQAIRYAAGLDNVSGELPARRAHVVNLSFAGSSATQSEEEACMAARAAGTLPVGASGNESSTARQYPGGYDSVLAVSATSRQGKRASYSSYGSWISLGAPGGANGDGVLVADRNRDGTFIHRTTVGSSFAAPHVSGVAALLMDLGALSPGEVQSLMEQTARDVGDPGFDPETGHGILDANAAVTSLLGLGTPLIIPGETVEVRLLSSSGSKVVRSATTSDTRELLFTFDGLPSGSYRLVAGTDRDFDGDIDDPGELYGVWTDEDGGELIRVSGDETRADLSIAVLAR
jgi:serine protease